MPDNSHSMTTEAARAVLNKEKFLTEFGDYSDAAVAVFVIRTRENVRAIHALQDYAIGQETDFKLWQCNTGWQTFENPEDLAEAENYRRPTSNVEGTVDIMKALGWLAASETPGIYAMNHPHSRLDNNVVHQWINDIAHRGMTLYKQRLVLIVPEDITVPVEVEQNVHIIDFRPPSFTEMREAYNSVMESIEPDSRPEFTEEQIDTFIQNAIGMTAQEFATAVSLAAISEEALQTTAYDELSSVFIREILTQKTQAVKKTNILTIMSPVPMDNVGGMDLLKNWLGKRAKGYSKEARDFGLAIPKGLLAVGPPGSGKSLFAKAVSSVFQVPLVVLDIGKVFDKYVGNSEGKMRAILQQVEDMAPCVLLVDEVDKGFGGMSGGGGDGGTTQRVLGTFLTWMQERDSETRPVFVVMTANNVIGLPPELFRKGRIDEIFAVTFPSEVERLEILKIHLSKRGHEGTLTDAELKRVVKVTENFVGAELESIVSDGLYTAYDTDDQALTVDILVTQAQSMKPLYDIFRDKVKAMLDWARNNAKPASTGMSFELPAELQAKPKPGAPRMIGRTAPRLAPPKAGRNMDG